MSTGRKKESAAEKAVEVVAAEAVAAATADLAARVAQLESQLASAQAEAKKPHRRRLPSERQSVTHKFEVAGHEGYLTVGCYPDGQPGEMFIRMAKEGSTVAGLMDSMAISVSVALQYGVPLRDLVNKFAHVRFEPSGFTGNPEIPIAKSIVDYIFRWLGSRFLPKEEREALGILDQSGDGREDEPSASAGISAGGDAPAELPGGPTAVAATAPPSAPDGGSAGSAGSDARAAGASAPVDAAASPAASAMDPRIDEPGQTAAQATPGSPGTSRMAGGLTAPAGSNGHGATGSNGASRSIGVQLSRSQKVAFQAQADAPSCADCGSIMVRNGSCYKCLNCGSTSGCS